MNPTLCYGILLAQRSRFDSLSSGFQGRRARIETEDIVAGLLVLGGLIVVCLLMSLVVRLRERRVYTSRTALFLSLCRAHRLPWRQWWLLWRVARRRRLRDPACLFLEPEHLEPGRLPAAFQARGEELDQLRERLFAEPEEEPPPRAGREAGDSHHTRPATAPPPQDRSPALDIPPWPPFSPEELHRPRADAP